MSFAPLEKVPRIRLILVSSCSWFPFCPIHFFSAWSVYIPPAPSSTMASTLSLCSHTIRLLNSGQL